MKAYHVRWESTPSLKPARSTPRHPPTPPHPQKWFFQFLVLGPGTYLTRSGPKFHAGGWSRFVKPRHMCRETPVFVLEVIWALRSIWTPKLNRSGGTLAQNAKVPFKCQFYYVFLRVTSPLTVIYSNLAFPAACPGSDTLQGPFSNTVRTPTS